jgi:phosphatidylserine/phosphatidylglycerophosphate/cardiolipin synthase-like enzyme
MEPLANPVTGFLGGAVEAYAGVRVSEPTAGARALLEVPVLGLAAGADYSADRRQVSPLLAWALPLRRGGIVGRGSLLRVEWLTASDAVGVSILVPLHQPWAGRTRPRSAVVSLPSRPAPAPNHPEDAPAALDQALGNVRAAALRIEELVIPALDESGADPRRALAPLVDRLRTPPALPGVDSGPDLQVEQVVRAFHAELARAFAVAASGRELLPGEATPTGDSLEACARGVLLEHVLLPFDRLLGQRKSGRVVARLGAYASGNFARAVLTEGLAPEERRDAVLYVFRELLGAVQAVERRARQRWDDSRELWLPLQLALLPEEHDTQAELDALVARAVGHAFTAGNRVSYVINEHLQSQVQQSIRDARDYHVLWIHDFRGVSETGEPDRMSLRYVVDAYLEALIAAVRAYDGDPRHRLPVFMIFLDEHYYEVNNGRLWLSVLEHPLYRPLVLPAGFDSLEAAVDSAQDVLRGAVAASRLLQAERRQYGEAWLENLVSVHVSVTYPADPSFRARGVVPLLGIPDDVIRDHRKIVFYDVSEEDPYRGSALYTGIGVGEHYSGPRWEDRAIIVQGPAVLSLKEQARQLLLSQGMRPEQVPFPLRPRARAADYDRKVSDEIDRQRAGGVLGQRAMELHNLTGYDDKPIDVARAVLYTLMPRGSVVKAPDSLWGCTLYAALLAGSAFRGVRVLIIAPSLAAAPSAGKPQMGLAYDLLARLIVLQQALGPELEAGGGMLKTGIYNPGIGVQDVMGRFMAAYRNARRTPFLRRLLPLDSSVDSMLVHLPDLLAAAGVPRGAAPGRAAPDTVMPKLHLKANFFASRDGWDSLVARPEVGRAVEMYIHQLVDSADPRAASERLSLASQQLVEGYLAGRSALERQRAVYYLLVGSANEDNRSAFLDGEASVLLSGRAAVVGLVDFALLVSLSVWVDDLDLLDDLLPPPSFPFRLVARWGALLF